MKTNDGGETWEESYVGVSDFFKIQFFDENAGYVLAMDLYIKTYTGGEYWHTMNNYTIHGWEPFEDMCFINPDVGFISGNDYLLRTIDGGETWQEEPDFPELFSNAVYFADDLNGWLVGQDGRIFHTTTGGYVGMDDPQDGPDNIDLRIFPNPANDLVLIKFQIPDNRDATIEIFSLTGKRIFHTIMKDLSRGEHVMPWDPEFLPAGIYLCRITAGSAASKEKIVLIK
jgi:hypothetical protein